MTFAPHVEGYESTVDSRISYVKESSHLPVGDPDKAANAMMALTENPEPPVHLVLGSEAVGILKLANAARQEGGMKKGAEAPFACTVALSGL